jgi:predicted phosphodiesterase
MLRIGIITDAHWTDPAVAGLAWHNPFDVRGVLDRLGLAAGRLRASGCDLLVCLGDLTHHDDADALAAPLAALRREWSGPLVLLPGNHDCRAVSDRVEAEPLAGQIGTQLAIQQVLLEQSDGFRGHLSRPTDAAESRIRVVVSHFPLLSVRERLESQGFKYAGDLENRAELAAQLAALPIPSLVLCGHLHARCSEIESSTLQLAVGAIVEPPFECAIVEIDPSDGQPVSVRRTALSLGASSSQAQLPVLSPDCERWRWADGLWSATPPEAGVRT